MRHLYRVIVLLLVAANAFGQLTQEQKISDFQNVAGIYNKNYGPYEWKRDALGFDLLNTSPWLDKIRATKNGLDIYDGKLLVDTITRSRLPVGTFPFQIGYELVSIDGVDAQQILDGLLQY